MANNSSATRQVTQPGAVENTPYVGPRPFQREDRDIFFGRNQEALELTSLIKAHPEVLLYAQSGAGKTSLIYAQAIPILDEEEEFDVLPAARVRSQESMAIPEEKIKNIYIFNALRDLSDNKLSLIERAQMTLAEYLKRVPRPPVKSPKHSEADLSSQNPDDEKEVRLPRVIIFDQFEEIFTLYPERYKDRQDFFRQVAEALEADPFLRVVFSMREDYIAELDPYIDILPQKLRTGFRLERLRKPNALSAVKQPLKTERVKNIGRQFADGVAESLVESLMLIKVKTASGEKREVPGEFVDPVQLQVVCQTLWEKLPSEERIITKEHLEKYANVDEALSDFYENSIRNAVATANAAIEASAVGTATSIAVSMITEGAVRGWFEQVLITREGKRNMVFRERETTGGLRNEVVDELEDQHLIRVEMRGGEPWYELSHDRFIAPIRESNRRWLQKQPLAKQKAQELEARAAEWLASSRDSSLLLDRSSLIEAKTWLASSEAKAIGYTETLYSFIKESEAAIEHEDRKYERALAAEQHHRIIAEQQRAKQLKLGFVVASILLLVAAASAVFAFRAEKRATTNYNAAQSALKDANDAKGRAELEAKRASREKDRAETAALQLEQAKENEKAQRIIADVARKKAERDRALAVRERASAEKARRQVQETNVVLSQKSQALSDSVEVAESRQLAAEASFWLSNNPVDALKRAVAAITEWPTDEAKYILRRAYLTRRSKERGIMSGNKDIVWKAVYSPYDGSIITISEDKTARVFDANNYQEKRVLTHPGPVHALAISKNGTIATEVAAADVAEVTGRIWKVNGGDPIDLHGLTGPVAALAFSPTEELLATEATSDGKKPGAAPRIWDATNGTIRQTLRGHEGAVCALAFSPKGDRLATASWDKTARIWEVATGREVAVLRGHTDRLTSVAFDPSGEHVVTGSDDGTARVWEAATGKPITVLQGLAAAVQGVTFSSNGKFILTVGKRLTSGQSSFKPMDNTVWVWVAETGRQVTILSGHTGQVNSATFSSDKDNSFVVTASEDGTARVWKTSTGENIAELRGHGGPVKSAMFSPDSQFVITAGADGTAQKWTMADPVKKARIPQASVLSAKFSSDGKSIVTLGADGVFSWEPTGKPISGSAKELKLGRVYDVAISPNSNFIVTASKISDARSYNPVDTKAHVWDVSSRGTPRDLGEHKGPVTRVLYSPNGSYVVTVSRDGTAGVWNTSTWKRLKTLEPNKVEKDAGLILAAAFDPDEKYVVTAQRNGTVHIWEIATGKNIRVIKAHDEAVTSVAFNAKGDLIVTASAGATAKFATAKIWTIVATKDESIDTLKLSSTLKGETGALYDAQFSRDSEFVVTSGVDGTRVWETQTGAPVTEFKEPEGPALNAGFSPDGTSIVTRDVFGIVYVFECEVCLPIDDVRKLAFKRYPKEINKEEIDRIMPK